MGNIHLEIQDADRVDFCIGILTNGFRECPVPTCNLVSED